MDFKERILKIIEYSNLSTSDFADAVEVPRSSISHITSGRNKPSLDFLIKIKTRFPELEWDWMISGTGDMQKTVSADIAAKTSPAPPDLFSIINDENFGKGPENSITIFDNLRDSSTVETVSEDPQLSNSQRLEVQENSKVIQNIENQPSKIKRIVMFFDNGKFESFEP